MGKRMRFIISGIWVLLVAIASVVFSLRGPVPQDPQYHAFVDVRSFLGVPNFSDVVSNLPFLFVGMYGARVIWRLRKLPAPFLSADLLAFTMFCFGVVCTGIGSAYYHWAPNNNTLVWDRLPMTIAFTGVMAMVVSDRLSPRLSAWLLIPFACTGAATVFYWAHTEALNRGDLRPYTLFQFVPLLMLPPMTLAFNSRYLKATILMHALVWYVIAKVLEAADHKVFEAWKVLGFELVSGHTLKHLAAAVGCWVIVRGFERQASAKRAEL